jgi:ZIP family zinc transporter
MTSPSIGSAHAHPNFGVAALLYLVIEELLVEAYEESGRQRLVMIAFFFAGFLIIYVLDGLTS